MTSYQHIEWRSGQSTGKTQANQRTLRRLLLAVLVMFGFAFALVPLYDVFCDLTGLNRGEVQALARNTQVDASRRVRLEFVANTTQAAGGAAVWRFTAPARAMERHPGELVRVDYELENLTDRPLTGRAVPSYGPAAAAAYFRKIECFCFRDQTLAPGEKRVLPVLFVLDRSLPADMGVVTLSYAFLTSPEG